MTTGDHIDEHFADLASSRTDSAALAGVLSDPAIGNFNVTQVHDQPYFSIGERIGDFLADRKRDDTLLLYISGHGVRNIDGELYFVATNTRADRIDDTAVSAERLARQISRSRAKRILLLLDCCFAGAFPGNAMPKAGAQVDLPELHSAGHVVISASSAVEYAFEATAPDGGKIPSSVFTEALILGLRTGDADLDQDGSITVPDLFGWLTASLRDLVPVQTPTMHGSGLQGDFIVAKNPVPVNRLKDLPKAPVDATEVPARNKDAHELVWLSDALTPFLDELEAAADGGRIGAGVTISSGLSELDEITTGFGRGDLVLVTGQNGAGKSVFALGIARAAAIHGNVNSLFLTYESNRTELLLRLLSAEAKVPLTHLRDGSMSDEDWTRLARSMAAIARAPLALIDDPALSLDSLAQTIDLVVDSETSPEELPAGHRLVLVDNLQLLANSDEPESLVGALRTLKLLAKAKGLAVVVTVAPDAALEVSNNPVGKLSRYADVVINISRPDLSGWEDRPGEADLMVIKNRHGHDRTLVVAFQGHYARFVDLAH